MGPIGCPETSVRNYHHSLHNNQKERSYYVLNPVLEKPGLKTEEILKILFVETYIALLINFVKMC